MKDRMLIERFIMWYYSPLLCKLGFHKYHITKEKGIWGIVEVQCSRCFNEEYGYRALHDGIACKEGTHIVVGMPTFWGKNNFDEELPKHVKPSHNL